VLLGETLGALQLAGLAAAILGVALINWPAKRNGPP
jgi:drug/metabolite transporter (DMT)-like permease